MTNPQKRSEKLKVRLVVRRTRLVGPQAEFWPNWRHHAFVTNLDLVAVEADRHHQPDAGDDDSDQRPDTRRKQATVEADRHHRSHASCELAIRDLNARPRSSALRCLLRERRLLLCAALAHNLYRRQPRGNTAGRAAGVWTHHPHPTLRSARTPRQPQRTPRPGSSGPMALERPTKPPTLTSEASPNSAEQPPPHHHKPPNRPVPSASRQPDQPLTPSNPSDHVSHHQTTPDRPRPPPE